MTLDENAEVVTAQDYYPFGEILRSYSLGGLNGKYKFTEKERDTETNYDYFSARFYDSKHGRWYSSGYGTLKTTPQRARLYFELAKDEKSC
ncbi:hypothetical protein BMS3Abin03_01644 [bacterium BMS3Abin03]|nr:hypothetical protein BMS3Abin03_01644 [bacterium BMS3Abin03]